MAKKKAAAKKAWLRGGDDMTTHTKTRELRDWVIDLKAKVDGMASIIEQLDHDITQTEEEFTALVSTERFTADTAQVKLRKSELLVTTLRKQVATLKDRLNQQK